jgi:hypothetical protein
LYDPLLKPGYTRFISSARSDPFSVSYKLLVRGSKLLETIQQHDDDFVSRYSDRFFADANDVIARSHRPSGRINSERALANKNYKSIPSHANIIRESVKCGKPDCNRCKHGPYYYAYWKENGKLKKKYVGRFDQATYLLR